MRQVQSYSSRKHSGIEVHQGGVIKEGAVGLGPIPGRRRIFQIFSQNSINDFNMPIDAEDPCVNSLSEKEGS